LRVLFLDFDGVLHVGPNVQANTAHWCWLPALEEALARHDDVRIVVHSTWRHSYGVAELRELLGRVGKLVVGVTIGATRLEGIEQWLAEHPEVSSFRIVDDDERDFCERPRELILCDPAKGIADPPVRQQLVAWLQQTS